MVCPSLLCQIKTLSLCLIFGKDCIVLCTQILNTSTSFYPQMVSLSVLFTPWGYACLCAFMEGKLRRSHTFGGVCLQKQLPS
jgi:hypothetical protein